jgi:hypothetical protein
LFAGHKFVCAALAVVLPVSLMADDSTAAMLHHDGRALVNGSPAPPSTAIFPNDTVQTLPQHEATINASGSAVTVAPETLVQFDGDELILDHGALQVSTSRELRVRVGCITVIPATSGWTQYDVTDVDGKVTVAARKSDVNIDSRGSRFRAARAAGRNERVTVREGEQKTRDEHCGAAPKPPRYIDAKGAILNSPYVKWPAAGAIIVGTCLILCDGDDPVSPSRP